jgi:hypothetical protein
MCLCGAMRALLMRPACDAGGPASARFRRPNMRAGRAVDVDEAANAVSLLEDVELAELHRCMHVHAMLGDVQVRALFASALFKNCYFAPLSSLSALNTLRRASAREHRSSARCWFCV